MNSWTSLFDYLKQESLAVSYSSGGRSGIADPRGLVSCLAVQATGRWGQGESAARQESASMAELLEQPALRAMLPPLAGLDVLELGRRGRQLAEYCRAAGARHVVGVDLRLGAGAPGGAGRESLETVERLGESYDLVVSSLAVHAVEDFHQLAQQVRARLRRGGVFVYSAEHPVVTASRRKRGWIMQEQGQKLFWPMDDYAAEGERREQRASGEEVTYHRRVSTQLNALMRSGFLLEQVEEPCPAEGDLAGSPDLAGEYRRPPYLVVRARRA